MSKPHSVCWILELMNHSPIKRKCIVPLFYIIGQLFRQNKQTEDVTLWDILNSFLGFYGLNNQLINRLRLMKIIKLQLALQHYMFHGIKMHSYHIKYFFFLWY